MPNIIDHIIVEIDFTIPNFAPVLDTTLQISNIGNDITPLYPPGCPSGDITSTCADYIGPVGQCTDNLASYIEYAGSEGAGKESYVVYVDKIIQDFPTATNIDLLPKAQFEPLLNYNQQQQILNSNIGFIVIKYKMYSGGAVSLVLGEDFIYRYESTGTLVKQFTVNVDPNMLLGGNGSPLKCCLMGRMWLSPGPSPWDTTLCNSFVCIDAQHFDWLNLDIYNNPPLDNVLTTSLELLEGNCNKTCPCDITPPPTPTPTPTPLPPPPWIGWSVETLYVHDWAGKSECFKAGPDITPMPDPNNIPGLAYAPCGSGHTCDRAKFLIKINDVVVLESNMNNHRDTSSHPSNLYGGNWAPYPNGVGENILDRRSFATITEELFNQIFPEGPSYEFSVSIEPTEDNPTPHRGVTWLRIKNEFDDIVYSCCVGIEDCNSLPCFNISLKKINNNTWEGTNLIDNNVITFVFGEQDLTITDTKEDPWWNQKILGWKNKLVDGALPLGCGIFIGDLCDKTTGCIKIKDQGFIDGGQEGKTRRYSWDSDTGFTYADGTPVIGCPWTINDNKLRIDFEKDGNCSKYNNNDQITTCKIPYEIDEPKTIIIDWIGKGEVQDACHELMNIKVNGVSVACAHAPGGSKGCGKVEDVVSTKDSPIEINLEKGKNLIEISVLTLDSFYHNGAYYEFTVDPLPCCDNYCKLKILSVTEKETLEDGSKVYEVTVEQNEKNCCSLQYKLSGGDWISVPSENLDCSGLASQNKIIVTLLKDWIICPTPTPVPPPPPTSPPGPIKNGWVFFADVNWMSVSMSRSNPNAPDSGIPSNNRGAYVANPENFLPCQKLFDKFFDGIKTICCPKYVGSLKNVYKEVRLPPPGGPPPSEGTVCGPFYEGAMSDTGINYRNIFLPVVHQALDSLGYVFTPIDITKPDASDLVKFPFLMPLYSTTNYQQVFTKTVIKNLQKISELYPVMVIGEWSSWGESNFGQSYDNFILEKVFLYTPEEISYDKSFPYRFSYPNQNNNLGKDLFNDNVRWFYHDCTGTFKGTLAEQFSFAKIAVENKPSMLVLPPRTTFLPTPGPTLTPGPTATPTPTPTPTPEPTPELCTGENCGGFPCPNPLVDKCCGDDFGNCGCCPEITWVCCPGQTFCAASLQDCP